MLTTLLRTSLCKLTLFTKYEKNHSKDAFSNFSNKPIENSPITV